MDLRRPSAAETEGGIGSRCLLVFSKPAKPGNVKTRLIGRLAAKQAAALHSAFLGDLLEEMAKGRFGLRMAWALEEGQRPPDLGVPFLLQQGEDLGGRLYRALLEAAADCPLVAAVGSDHPQLEASLVESAFDKLETAADVVLGPAGDGGYYLVAMRREVLQPRLFEGIPWSSEQVLSTTLQRCRESGLRVELLPTVPDIDTPTDLDRLSAELENDSRPSCRRTRALLAAWHRHGMTQGDERRDIEDP